MKLTKTKLKQIIREEIEAALDESGFRWTPAEEEDQWNPYVHMSPEEEEEARRKRKEREDAEASADEQRERWFKQMEKEKKKPEWQKRYKDRYDVATYEEGNLK